MAYFLGKDCDVFITTEATNSHINVTAAGTAVAATSNAAIGFAGDLEDGQTATTNWTAVQDLTGVDVSIGAMDEDVTYFGMRSVQKTEVKKETTVTLTRKKSDTVWDTIFNYPARWGSSGTTIHDGMAQPTTTHGFRLHVVLKSGTEVFTIKGSCVQGHTTSINADGSSEETMEFMSYVTPAVGTAAATGTLTDAIL